MKRIIFTINSFFLVCVYFCIGINPINFAQEINPTESPVETQSSKTESTESTTSTDSTESKSPTDSMSSKSSTELTSSTESLQDTINKVSTWLVRIDTIGGFEKVGNEFANEGTSTGILLDKDGYVLTSAFNFLHDPTSILLRFSNGTKKIARRIAIDRNRMLTLLKVDGLDTKFLPPETLQIRNKNEIKIAEQITVIAVALSPHEPNITQGIISGKNRIWQKAIQTDAAIGPNNYGGVLVGTDGKLMAIAVPLSMTSNELTAGSDTYDAGVGLAIPFEDVNKNIIEKLKNGKNLEPAFVGTLFKENQIFVGEPVLNAVAPKSPAEKAGLKKGDRITKINDEKIETALQYEMNIKPRYAGEKIELTYLRDGKENKITLETIPQPPPPKKKPQPKPMPMPK
ncbi:MAG: S1C family serine protease [Planctomycetaceae bacterium]|jgi:serine protease Do|nr:S1C family serine protease [Planctomycetaceae bacterium]